MDQIFFEITIIISFAAVLSILFRFLKQPAMLAYILTGIILGPLGLFHLANNDAIRNLGELGITLLLFMLGLELKISELRSLGKVALITGFLQMYFTFVLGFFLALLLGMGRMPALFMGICLTFSSTIIVVKLLSDKKDLKSLYGKIAVGVLLLQDLVAILTIILLASLRGSSQLALLPEIGLLIGKIIVLFGIVLFLSKTIFPKLFHILGRAPETLFLFSLAWVFAFTAFVSSQLIGFSVEIGGFLAGLALANTHENFQILAKMKALRDFFITIFFVTLGLQMTFSSFATVLPSAIVLSLFVLFVKPLIVIIAIGSQGFRKRTSLFTGLSLGQVSEFSFILLFLGSRLGYLTSDTVTLGIVTGMISFVFSSLLLQKTNTVYRKTQLYLNIFERKGQHKEHAFTDETVFADLNDHVVIIGGEHMGQSIINALSEEDHNLLVVDFDPDVVKKLRDKKVKAFFGDIADSEIQERAGLKHAKLVVSTISDLEDNLLLIEGLNHTNRKAKIVVVAIDGEDAKELYKAGADYVVLPHLAGGHHVAKLLTEKHLEHIENLKKRDMKYFQ